MRRLVFLAILATLSACMDRTNVALAPEVPAVELETGWRTILTSEDAQRLSQLPQTWKSALASSRRYQKQILSEGDLLVANAARSHPAPSPGSYRCRLVKLGAPVGAEPPFRLFSEFFCYIRGDVGSTLFFAKQTGTERPGGWLHPDGDRQLVLTGAKQRPGSDTQLTYGSEPERDLVGVVERIGPFRWRLVLPWRGTSVGLDVYELTPVPLEQQATEPKGAPAD